MKTTQGCNDGECQNHTDSRGKATNHQVCSLNPHSQKDSDMDIQRRLEDKNNPFGDRKTSERILNILKEFDPCPPKR